MIRFLIPFGSQRRSSTAYRGGAPSPPTALSLPFDSSNTCKTAAPAPPTGGTQPPPPPPVVYISNPPSPINPPPMASSLLSTPSRTLAPAPAPAGLRGGMARPAQAHLPRGGVLAPRRSRALRVRASVAIEKETPESEPPPTFLREDGRGAGSGSVRERFESMIRRVQGEVCAALEEADGSGAKFVEDVWSRPGGGGGISRVLEDGRVFEKAGVNVSVVYGVMPPDAYRAAKGEAGKNGAAAADGHKAGPVPFFAAGISSVLHPKNPFAPTLHFNYRYFETDAPKDVPGAPRQWWFGGGTDLTPSYIIEEDVKHFHSVQKQACDKFDPSFHPRFKKWCDDYFYIKHRNERRGLGGIFFDDLNDYDQEMLLNFATECADSVLPAYIPIIERRKDTPFNEEHKAWQQLRRGRYVEFNLVYDRGTTFGLKTGGRIESILVSLPLTARWQYDHKPEEGTEEWKLLDACINPKDWI